VQRKIASDFIQCPGDKPKDAAFADTIAMECQEAEEVKR